jgi:hypothetical protein
MERTDLWTRAYGGTLLHAWERVGSKPGFGPVYRALCNPRLQIGHRGVFLSDKKCPKCERLNRKEGAGAGDSLPLQDV